ncbi:uncharacterized protein cubi_02676 [Cryptosporidium ubiquitum]|uniref:Uncharacterized protein n=1 Tax=Cryptosporidium ubiquitum TaxID=857276 RepID=A0A1J4MHY5_9CRYT|nr:uncharacterized protein cubi_02676 [Cryptosporidium ubiquitum]OII73874.1 hypothetical protein cubi_02676 [Cryptosporidium ubiquitum]
MWENLDPVWGTGAFEKFYSGVFGVLLSSRPEELDEWWDLNKECVQFVDAHIKYLSNPLYSLPRDSALDVRSGGSQLGGFLRERFPKTAELLLEPQVLRLCEDISVELSLHQLEVFGFIDLALQDPSLQSDSGQVELASLSSTILELYCRELKFLLLIIRELANNSHPCVVLGVLCDSDSDLDNREEQASSDSPGESKAGSAFTSQCPPICIYGCSMILESGFIRNAVNSVFQSIQEVIKLGQANIKTDSQSMVDLPSNSETSDCLRDHYRNVIIQLTDTIAILLSRFSPNLDEVEALMELIPNAARMQPSFLTNRPTAADFDSWDGFGTLFSDYNGKGSGSECQDSKQAISRSDTRLSLSAKILLIIIICFDNMPNRWERTKSISATPNSIHETHIWFCSSSRLPKSSKSNFFSTKHSLITKLSQDVTIGTSGSLSIQEEQSRTLSGEFWDIDAPLGRFAAFSINGAFGQNSKKRFMGLTHWRTLRFIQDELLPRLDPQDPVGLVFIQAIYDICSVALSPTQDPIQWSRILQLQRRILMERDSKIYSSERDNTPSNTLRAPTKNSVQTSNSEPVISILSPLVCCLDSLCRRYPLASWGASKVLSSCIEMFPTLSMYSSFGETEDGTSASVPLPPVLSELFVDLLDLAATIMAVGHYSLGQQVAHFLQNQPSNFWFHLPSILLFISRTLLRKDDILSQPEDHPRLGIWSGAGLDNPRSFRPICRAVLRILSAGFSSRLCISSPPPPPLLSPSLNLHDSRSVPDFLILLLRDSFENRIFEDPKLLYTLLIGSLDVFSQGVLHSQSSEILAILSSKIPLLSKVLQHSINQNDSGIFLIKLFSSIISLQFRISSINHSNYCLNDENNRNAVNNTEYNIYGKADKHGKTNSFFDANGGLSKSQLPLIRWVMLEILPIIHKLNSIPTIRKWTISALVLKFVRLTLSNPLPESQQNFTEDSDATIWLFRCLLSIDSPSFHQLMALVIPPEDPFLSFLQTQNRNTSSRPKLLTAKTGLEIIRILFQRDNLFLSWVNYHKSSLRRLCTGSLSRTGGPINIQEVLLDTEALDAVTSSDSSLIHIHEQLALPVQEDLSPSQFELLNLKKNEYYRVSLLRYIIIGTDPDLLKTASYIACQLLHRDPEALTALLTSSPALLLQLRSSFSRIFSSPDLDRFPTSIQGLILDSEDSFNIIWNNPNSFIPAESESGTKSYSLVADQQAVYWDEITEADPTSSLYSCENNLLGMSFKTLLPIHNELELNYRIYIDSLVESADLSLWCSLKTTLLGELPLSSKLEISRTNEAVLNGFLQLLPPTFIPNKSSLYNKISRFHLTSTRTLIAFALSKAIEDRFMVSSSLIGSVSVPNIAIGARSKALDTASSAVPLLLGLGLGMATDVPTIKEYLIFSTSNDENYSSKTYEEIYIPDASSSADESTFPLLTIMDILSAPPQIPLSHPNDQRPCFPSIDFAILSQLEFYYLTLRLTVNLLKVPQLLDFSLRLLSERFNSRFSILKERILLPVTWIPPEYRWLHFLHLALIVHLVSSEIFVVSQVSSALKEIQCLELHNSLLRDPFWLSCIQNLHALFRLFLTPPKTSSSSHDQLDILSPILNIAHYFLENESSPDIELLIQQNPSQTYLFCSFLPYLTAQTQVCGIYRTSLQSIVPDHFGNQKLIKDRFPITLAPSISSISCRLFINEYVQLLGLLLNKFSRTSPQNHTELESRDIDANVFSTLQTIIELCRPFINFSFFKKTPEPFSSAILSIFSQTLLTTLRHVHTSFSSENIYSNDESSLRLYLPNNSISEIQRQKICFTTIQDCCEDLVRLLVELEKTSSTNYNSNQYFPQGWKNTLLLLLSNCIAMDSIQFFNKNNQETNEPFTSSFLQQIWPEVWTSHKNNKNLSNKSSSNRPFSTFIEFVSLLINNLRILSKRHEHEILKRLDDFLPSTLESRNTSWVLKSQEFILLSQLDQFKISKDIDIGDVENENHRISELCNWMPFNSDLLFGAKNQHDHSFLSLYLLFLIYNKIHVSSQSISINSSGLVPCITGDEHIQNLYALIENSKFSRQCCHGSLVFWNYITINWIRMSPSFLRRIIESDYINCLLSQEVVLTALQDCHQLFLDLKFVSPQVSFNLQLEKAFERAELVISIFSLLLEIMNRGILPKNILAGYGSIDNFEVIIGWITKLEAFFSSLFDFFLKHLLFCQQKKSDWQFHSENNQYMANSGRFGSILVIEKFSPILCSVYSLFSKVIIAGYHISDLKSRMITGTEKTVNLNSSLKHVNAQEPDTNFIMINILHSRTGQILETASQMASLIPNFNHLNSLIFSCVSWFESEVEFLSHKSSRSGVEVCFSIQNSPPINPLKLKLEIARWLSNCISYLTSSLKDGIESKPSHVVQDVVSVLARASLTILLCNSKYSEPLNSISSILSAEDPFQEAVKICITSINFMLSSEIKNNFLNSKLSKTSRSCKSELELLKEIKIKLESFHPIPN